MVSIFVFPFRFNVLEISEKKESAQGTGEVAASDVLAAQEREA